MNLSGFYHSKEWIRLTNVLRMERMNENGEIICEYCGKPIVHKYDCIGHHTTELNEQNVNDATIALNPDNVMLVHHRCHNKIHDRLGLSYTKQVFLVYGSPLSGKTTWVHNNMSYGDIIVDMDSIWSCISGQDRYIKPNRLKQNAFAIRDTLIDMIRVRRGNWLNAYIIGGYPLVSERERLIRILGARAVFIDTPQEECIKRFENSDRPKEYLEYINEWWERYSP